MLQAILGGSGRKIEIVLHHDREFRRRRQSLRPVHWRILAAIICRRNRSNSFEFEKARRSAFGVINAAKRGSLWAIFLSRKRSCLAAAACRARFAIWSDGRKG